MRFFLWSLGHPGLSILMLRKGGSCNVEARLFLASLLEERLGYSATFQGFDSPPIYVVQAWRALLGLLLECVDLHLGSGFHGHAAFAKLLPSAGRQNCWQDAVQLLHPGARLCQGRRVAVQREWRRPSYDLVKICHLASAGHSGTACCTSTRQQDICQQNRCALKICCSWV